MTSDKTRKPASRQNKRAVKITTYAALHEFIDKFVKGKFSLLVVIGGPGLGKSQSVRRALGEESYWIEGNASAFGLYEMLYEHRNKYIVIDDVDGLYADRNAVGLLKCLCQTDPVKRVTWHTKMSARYRDILPQEFTSSSRVVIISNDWRSLNKNIQSLEDRGHILNFQPTVEEIHREAGTWFKDKEIYHWFEWQLDGLESLSFRDYVRAFELKDAEMDWTKVLGEVTSNERENLITELMTDLSYPNMQARLNAFMRRGGGSTSTFWKYARRWREEHGG